MLPINNKNPSNTVSRSSSKPLLAFKPRQVLLAEHNRRIKMTTSVSQVEKSSKITSLTSDLKEILHRSIIHYLHRNGFSKTLKRFQSEAQIQNDTWKDSSLHLEDIYYKYINGCNSDSNLKTSKKPELGNDETIKRDIHNVCATNEETASKKKKKKDTIESDGGAIKDQSKAAESRKNCGQTSEDIVVTESETKPKKKKKTKHDSDSPGHTEEAKSDVLQKPVDDTVNGFEIDDSTKKPKNKKKKSTQQEKEEDKLESCTTNSEFVTDVAHKDEKKKKKKKKSSADSAVEEDQAPTVKTETENGVEADVTKKDKKSSKKRKRLPSDENDHLSTEMETIEESKRQKADASEEQKNKGVLVKGDEVNESKAQETSNKQLDGLANGKLEINGGEKSGSQKSTRKQHNGSAEPRTVNAFQRVKIDQVEFAHEKLQDNSYWAKDGAEVGYGAKAQEVLGQVRGRDFRHEKTKKKRGSYRGGLIDLHSHSIKFNYSDEE